MALTGLVFTDTLPAGHLVSATPNLVNNCGGAVTATSGANTVSLAGGSLAGGAVATSCTILVNITTPAGTRSGTDTIAAGAVSSAEGFVNAAAASATVTRVVTAVTINKSFNPATVLVGGVSQLTINIINTNANAIAFDRRRAKRQFPRRHGGGGRARRNQQLRRHVYAGRRRDVGVAGQTLRSPPIRAAASRSTSSPTRRATSSIRLVPARLRRRRASPIHCRRRQHWQRPGVANLGVSKTDGVASVVPGTSTTYTIVASNAGPNAVAGASVVDNPPAGVTFTSWTCVASAGSACGNASGSGPINELISLLNAGTATYTVTAAVAPGATGTIANTVTVNVPPTVVDPTPGNNTATDTDTLTPVASLGISKTDGSATYTPGGTATYTVVVMNAGPSNATSVTVSDPLPAGVTLSANVTCVPAGAASRWCGHGHDGADELRHDRRDDRRRRGQQPHVQRARALRLWHVDQSAGQHGDGDRPVVAARGRCRNSDARLAVAALAVTKTDGSATYTPGATATYTVDGERHGRRAVENAPET